MNGNFNEPTQPGSQFPSPVSGSNQDLNKPKVSLETMQFTPPPSSVNPAQPAMPTQPPRFTSYPPPANPPPGGPSGPTFIPPSSPLPGAKKPKGLKVLVVILVILIIAVIGVAFYFYIWPKFFKTPAVQQPTVPPPAPTSSLPVIPVAPTSTPTSTATSSLIVPPSAPLTTTSQTSTLITSTSTTSTSTVSTSTPATSTSTGQLTPPSGVNVVTNIYQNAWGWEDGQGNIVLTWKPGSYQYFDVSSRPGGTYVWTVITSAPITGANYTDPINGRTGRLDYRVRALDENGNVLKTYGLLTFYL